MTTCPNGTSGPHNYLSDISNFEAHEVVKKETNTSEQNDDKTPSREDKLRILFQQHDIGLTYDSLLEYYHSHPNFLGPYPKSSSQETEVNSSKRFHSIWDISCILIFLRNPYLYDH